MFPPDGGVQKAGDQLLPVVDMSLITPLQNIHNVLHYVW